MKTTRKKATDSLIVKRNKKINKAKKSNKQYAVSKKAEAWNRL